MAHRYANIWSRGGGRPDRARAHARRRVPLGRRHAADADLDRRRPLVLARAAAISRSDLSHRERRRHVGCVFRRRRRADVQSITLQVVRFAALAVPAVGLLFAFSGQLGRSLARIFNLGAAHHVVIAGDSPAALSLALDCRRYKDSRDPDRRGFAGRNRARPAPQGRHRARRRRHADRNAAHRARPSRRARRRVRAGRYGELADRSGRAPPGRRRAPQAADRRSRRDALADAAEGSARNALGADAQEEERGRRRSIPSRSRWKRWRRARWCSRKARRCCRWRKQLGQDRVHIVFFGFDAGRRSGGRARADEPVVGAFRGAAPHRAGARSAKPSKRASARAIAKRSRIRDVWAADIAFMPFDWDAASDRRRTARRRSSSSAASRRRSSSPPAPIPATSISRIALKRACNHGLRWPVPIYMREASQSEFSQQYAQGRRDRGARRLPASVRRAPSQRDARAHHRWRSRSRRRGRARALQQGPRQDATP